MKRKQPSDRTIAAWKACGFTADEAADRCSLDPDEMARRYRRLHRRDLPPEPGQIRLTAGPLEAMLLIGRPWIPLCDAPEVSRWLDVWEKEPEVRLWQVARLHDGKGATASADFARLFLLIHLICRHAQPPPVLLVGVNPRVMPFYKHYMGFKGLVRISAWEFAGCDSQGRPLPAVVMVRHSYPTPKSSARVASWVKRLDERDECSKILRELAGEIHG